MSGPITHKEYQLEDGTTVVVTPIEGGDIVTRLDGELIPPGSYRLANKKKIIVGETGLLIDILKSYEPEPAHLRVAYSETKRKDERKERAADIGNNIKYLIKSR